MGLYYILNDTNIVNFGTRLSKKLGVIFKIEPMEGKYNMADWGSVALSSSVEGERFVR